VTNHVSYALEAQLFGNAMLSVSNLWGASEVPLINALFDSIDLIRHLDDSESMFKRPLYEISIVGREYERQDLGSCAG